MLAFHLFTISLTILSSLAHPILPRQDRPEGVSASPSLVSQSATPTISDATPTPSLPVSESASVPVASPSESSIQPSASSISRSASEASESAVSTSSEPIPTPSQSEQPTPLSVPTFTPEPLTIVEKAPVSSVTHYITAVPEPSGSAVASGATSTSAKSFWDNKPAVIGTFTVVGLVSLALIALAFFAIQKRKMQESLETDFFEKFNDSESQRSESRIGNGSPHPSMNEMHSQKPMAVDYGATAAVAPHLGFNTQGYQHGYAAGAPRSHGRAGSGDSFYGAGAGAQPMPTYRY